MRETSGMTPAATQDVVVAAGETTATDTQAGARRKQAWVGVICMGLLSAFLLWAIFYSLPSNVLSTRDGSLSRRIAVTVAPEGWAFFTKSPHLSEYVPYRVSNGTLLPALAPPQSKAENWFGLSRKQRAQGPELARITNQASKWHDCDNAETEVCRNAVLSDTPARADNNSPVPTLCGRIVIVETVPVPWSYRESYAVNRLDKRATLVEVACT